MKFNKLSLVCIFLLVVLTLGAVSASDDTSDITADEDSGEVVPDGDPVVSNENDSSQDTQTHVTEFSMNVDDSRVGTMTTVWMIIDENATGNMTFSVDGENLTANARDYDVYDVDTRDFPIGNYTLTASYIEEGLQSPLIVEKDFEIVSIFEYPEEFDVNWDYVKAYLPSDAAGNITVFIDGEELLVHPYESGIEFDTINLYNASLGVRNVTLVYSGDGKYKSSNATGVINFTYSLRAVFNYGDIGYTKELLIDAPADINYTNLNVTIDGVRYDVMKGVEDDFEYLYADISSLNKAGHFPMVISYPGDDKYYPITVEDTFTAIYLLDIPEEVPYQSDSNITLELKDAKGKFVVKISQGSSKTVYNEVFEDGKASVSLSDLDPGIYEVEASYKGDDYIFDTVTANITVYPKIEIEGLVAVGNATVKMILPEGVCGTLYIWKDSESKADAYKIAIDGSASDGVYLYPIGLGDHWVSAQFECDDTSNSAYNLSCADDYVYVYPIEEITPTNVNYDENPCASMTLPEDASGILSGTIYADDLDTVLQSINATFENGTANITFDILEPGKYFTVLKYTGDDYGPYETVSFPFSVGPKFESPRSVMENESAYLYFELPNATGNLTIKLDGEVVANITCVNDTFNYTFDKLTPGAYIITAVFEGENDTEYTYNIEVGAPCYVVAYTNMTVDVETIAEGEDAVIKVEIPYAESGEVNITVANKTYTAEITDNVTSLTVSGLSEGTYDVVVAYEGDQIHTNATKNATFEVKKVQDTALIVKAADIEEGSPVVIEIETDEEITGDVLLSVGDVNMTVSVTNGKGNATVDNLTKGNYSVIAVFEGSQFFKPAQNSTSFNVTKVFDPVLKANDITIRHLNKADYTITVYNKDGELAVGENVTIEIDGVKVADVVTNESGVATYTITGSLGTYKLSAYALGANVTNTLTVKHFIKIKSLKVKKSARKWTITAKLYKVNGKYLKNKKVTLKVNGKKYKVRTSKKGVATFTIKKSAINKFRVKTKYIYAVTYKGDTVKKYLKVKR
ncbi:hypothetical protein [Methanobrevibacter sp.]|uniref:hypothetical protein n=1 Tax=Methanobrevibacter sp. TaxID=66852 RepID=UPI00388E5EF9